MPDGSTLLLFAAACVALTITPGPDMLLIASRSLTQGRMAGFLTYFGIALGCYCHALAAGLGLSQLFLAVPAAFDAVRWAGAAYLHYLAWKALRAPAATPGLNTATRRLSPLRMFSEGLLTNLLNPKVALFMVALLPQFLHPEAGSMVLQSLVLASGLNGIGLLVNGTVVVLSGHIHSRLNGFGRYRWLPRTFLAAVFTGLACRLALGGRN